MVDLEFAVQTMVVGFTMVLFTLFLLYLILLLFGKIFTPKELEVAQESPLLFTVQPSVLSKKKVAAITAAITLYLENEENSYIITGIESVEKSNRRWADEGRKELMSMRDEIDKIRREKDGKKVF